MFVIVVAILAVFAAGCVESPPYIVRADLNGDGIDDMVITSYDTNSDSDLVSVLMGGTNESFAQQVLKYSIEPGSTVVFDLNKDKKLDIIFRSNYIDSDWDVLYGKGDGTFEKVKELEPKDMQNIKYIYKSK